MPSAILRGAKTQLEPVDAAGHPADNGLGIRPL